MQRTSEAAARLLEIEQQQDAVLAQLEELERRTEAVLAEHAPYRAAIEQPLDLPPPAPAAS